MDDGKNYISSYVVENKNTNYSTSEVTDIAGVPDKLKKIVVEEVDRMELNSQRLSALEGAYAALLQEQVKSGMLTMEDLSSAIKLFDARIKTSMGIVQGKSLTVYNILMDLGIDGTSPNESSTSIASFVDTADVGIDINSRKKIVEVLNVIDALVDENASSNNEENNNGTNE